MPQGTMPNRRSHEAGSAPPELSFGPRDPLASAPPTSRVLSAAEFFGEEIGYRGYLLGRAADVGGRTPMAYWLSLVPVSVLFGIGHYYKGPAGMIDSGIGGFVFGAVYLLSGRNLWPAILAHGFVDTLGIVLLYLGLAS